jgi:uncharacterized Tic20 family protein
METPQLPSPEEKSERTWAMLCHLSALLGFLGIPLANIAGPLVIWLIKKDQMPLVDVNGKEALNFQISLTIYAIVGALLTFVLVGFLVLAAVFVGGLVCVIIASVKVNNGESYSYPFTIRLVK